MLHPEQNLSSKDVEMDTGLTLPASSPCLVPQGISEFGLYAELRHHVCCQQECLCCLRRCVPQFSSLRYTHTLHADEDGAPAPAPQAAKEAQPAPKRSIPGLNTTRSAATSGARTDADADAAPQRDARSTRGGRGRGEGRGRGSRPVGRGRARHGGFDRQSGTGKSDSAKRIEQGWGGDDPQRELDAESKARIDADQEDDGQAKSQAEPNGAAEEAAPAEKDNTKTLDEYLAEQASKRAQIGAVKTARPAEAVDNLGTKFEKAGDEDYYSVKTERALRQRDRKEKQIIEIDQTFNGPPAAGRGRGRGGARGGGRGRGGADRGGADRGRGRGRGRGGRSGGANLNLSDDAAFPTLA